MTLENIGMLVVGAIIGFLASIIKDWIMENRKDEEKKKQFQREKLEEMFILLDKFNDGVMQPISQFTPFVEKAKLGMIIRFYSSDKIQKSYKILLEASSEVLKAKRSGANYFDCYFEKFMPEYMTLLSKIVEESKKYY